MDGLLRRNADGPLIRLHVGLKDTNDLISDLTHGFEQMNLAIR
jgi:cystathionine beta-lyase/cystathionine gamma-synthase